MIFSELQTEVSRGAIRNQSGTVFSDAIKNVINRSLFRINREAPWRTMRRKTTFTTKASYSTGSGAVAVTDGSANVTVTGATFLTDGIEIGRRFKASGSSKYYYIDQITGEDTLVLTENFSGTTATDATYSILGQEQYNLPIEAGHRMFMWHEQYGYPFKMWFLTDQEFYDVGYQIVTQAVPEVYRMWGSDMIIEQVRTPSVITIVSSSSSDTTGSVTVFGTVAGFPDFETINLNGTTPVPGGKTFQSVERVVRNGSTAGRIIATANSGNTNVSVLPVGNTTTGILYKKVQLFPLPSEAFKMQVQYYKDTYKLVNDGDVHELGEDFDQAIIFLAIAILKYENNQDEGDKFLGLYKDEMKTLRRVNMDKIDWFPRLKRAKDSVRGRKNLFVARNLTYSQVGAYYGPRVG